MRKLNSFTDRKTQSEGGRSNGARSRGRYLLGLSSRQNRCFWNAAAAESNNGEGCGRKLGGIRRDAPGGDGTVQIYRRNKPSADN